jgi:hypothetical protein
MFVAVALWGMKTWKGYAEQGGVKCWGSWMDSVGKSISTMKAFKDLQSFRETSTPGGKGGGTFEGG